MKKSSPISLFSFQDIITCLTGIMIVVVLVILLQLVESTAAVIKRLEMQPDYKALKEKEKKLEAEKKKALLAVKSGEKSASEYAKKSLPEIEQMLQEELNNRDALLRQLEMFREKERVQQENLQRSEQNLTSLRRELTVLQQDKSKFQAVEKKLRSHLQQQKVLRKNIADKRKSLRIQIRGGSDLTPLLVECNSWGFRCKVHPSGEVKQFGTPGSGGAPAQLSAMQKWLREQGSKTFVVLLFRPGSLAHYGDIRNAMGSRQIGKELIDSSEEIFR